MNFGERTGLVPRGEKMKSRMTRRLTVLTTTMLAMLVLSSPAWAQTFTVTNTNDSGMGR